jgi:hypothetical protein
MPNKQKEDYCIAGNDLIGFLRPFQFRRMSRLINCQLSAI